jgi:hypothetical protein
MSFLAEKPLPNLADEGRAVDKGPSGAFRIMVIILQLRIQLDYEAKVDREKGVDKFV